MAHAIVNIKSTCIHGGNEGKVLHTQTFPTSPSVPWYWVVVPAIHPTVGFWYQADCLDIQSGQLPEPDPDNSFRHRVEKGGNVAYFYIDKATKQVLIDEGYTVTFEPPE